MPPDQKKPDSHADGLEGQVAGGPMEVPGKRSPDKLVSKARPEGRAEGLDVRPGKSGDTAPEHRHSTDAVGQEPTGPVRAAEAAEAEEEPMAGQMQVDEAEAPSEFGVTTE